MDRSMEAVLENMHAMEDGVAQDAVERETGNHPARGVALKLTKFETEAVLHQLRQWHRFSGWFDRRTLDRLAPMANARARALHEALLADETGTLALTASELDREILACVVEDSTWVRAHAHLSHQKQSAAFGALQSIAEKIELAFQLDRRLRIPIH